MAGEPMRFRNPAGHRGLLDNLFGALHAFVTFFESRFELAAHESKSALINVVVLIICIVAAAMLCGIAFMFVLVSAVAGVAHALHVWWVWVALAVALILFVLAILCVIIARTRMKKPMFRATATELKKDREWLKTLSKNDL
jgi:uncharacterized membrane protein YqjE